VSTHLPSPPRLAVWLTRSVLRSWEQESTLGDLEELYAQRVKNGVAWSNVWFWAQALLFVLYEIGNRVRDPLGQRRRWEEDARGKDPVRRGREPGRVEVGTMILGLMQTVRRMMREWRFSTSMILILGIGVGAGLVMFSVVDRVLMQPLPYEAPEELALIRIDLGEIQDHPGLAMAEVADIRTLDEHFVQAETAAAERPVTIETDGALEPVQAAAITPGLFSLLGVQPFMGRIFTEEEADADGDFGIVVSHGFWQGQLGGDADAIGRSVLMDGRQVQVLGVMPAGFALHLGSGTNISPDVAIWLPLRLNPLNRGFWGFRTVVRLQDGRTFEQANAALASLANSMAEMDPEAYGGSPPRILAKPLHQDLVREARPAINAALGGVVLLLLVAFANAASLMLGRQKAREADLAVRSALGAGRSRLMGTVLGEAFVLTVGAAVLGAALAGWTVAALRTMSPPGVPRWDTLGVDWTFFLAAFALAGLGFVFSGLLPALRLSDGSAWQVLRGGSLSRGVAGAGVRRGLVGVQVSLAVVLLFGAIVLGRSAIALGEVDLGFDPSNTLSVAVPVDQRGMEDRTQVFDIYRTVQQRLASLPGVTSVGAISHVPLLGYAPTDGYSHPLADTINWGDHLANYYGVFPGYFETVGMELRAGRFLDELDLDEARPVAVVDESLAADLYPDEEPIGKTIKPGWGLPELEIVGVIRHPRVMDVREEVRGQIYTPVSVFRWLPLNFVVKSEGDPMALTAAVRDEIKAAGAGRAPYQFRSLESYVEESSGAVRFTLMLIVAQAALTALLAAFGLFSVIAYLVRQSRRATAIRSALGATREELVGHHLRGGTRILLVAIPTGVVLAVLGATLFQSMIFGVAVRDVASLLAASALAAAVGLFATYVPARSAARADPMETLRTE
jgi:putative ABC transport system permease protein